MKERDTSPVENLSDNGPTSLSQQIESLLAEPFAEENQLGELTLESIEYLLEETKQILEKEEVTNFTLTPTSELEESFTRCLSLFCSILMELETQNLHDFLTETLVSIKQSQNQTRLISARPPAPPTPLTTESTPAPKVSDFLDEGNAGDDPSIHFLAHPQIEKESDSAEEERPVEENEPTNIMPGIIKRMGNESPPNPILDPVSEPSADAMPEPLADPLAESLSDSLSNSISNFSDPNGLPADDPSIHFLSRPPLPSENSERDGIEPSQLLMEPSPPMASMTAKVIPQSPYESSELDHSPEDHLPQDHLPQDPLMEPSFGSHSVESSITPLFTQSKIVDGESPAVNWDPDDNSHLVPATVSPREESAPHRPKKSPKNDKVEPAKGDAARKEAKDPVPFQSGHDFEQLSIPEMMERGEATRVLKEPKGAPSSHIFPSDSDSGAVPPAAEAEFPESKIELTDSPIVDSSPAQSNSRWQEVGHLPSFSEIKEVNKQINSAPGTGSKSLTRQSGSATLKHVTPKSAYRQLSELLEHELLPAHTDIAAKSLNKVITLTLCGELEECCQELLEPLLSKIWGVREALITPLMRQDDRRFEFHPQLRAALEDLGVTHSAWLFEGKLPYSGILGALKYLMSTQDRMKYRPTPIDYGMILLLFGQDETMGGFLLQNHLEFPCPTEDVTEIAFRLFRVHKFRQLALNVRRDFTAVQLDTMRQDTWNILRVLESYATRPPAPAIPIKKAAQKS